PPVTSAVGTDRSFWAWGRDVWAGNVRFGAGPGFVRGVLGLPGFIWPAPDFLGSPGGVQAPMLHAASGRRHAPAPVVPCPGCPIHARSASAFRGYGVAPGPDCLPAHGPMWCAEHR